MKPLSPLRRRLYVFALVALFFLVVPIAFLYAAGWRYKEGFGFVHTGGIFVYVPYSGATISLNGKPVGESGFLNHRLYLSDLAPSAYVVQVSKKGYTTWNKILVVEPSLVTDAQSLLVPDPVQALKLTTAPVPTSSTVSSSTSLTAGSSAQLTASTTSEQVSAAQLLDIRDAFVESFASSTDPRAIAHDGMRVVVEGGNASVLWTDPNRRIPSAFCGRPSYCVQVIPIEDGPRTTVEAAFYGGGVVYATKEGGIFFSEADVRPTVTALALYPKAGATFRIVQGALIVKYKNDYYHLTGF